MNSATVGTGAVVDTHNYFASKRHLASSEVKQIRSQPLLKACMRTIFSSNVLCIIYVSSARLYNKYIYNNIAYESSEAMALYIVIIIII